MLLLDFLADTSIARCKKLTQTVKVSLDFYVSQYICKHLVIERQKGPRFNELQVVVDEHTKAIRICSGKTKAIELANKLLELRPDLHTMIIDQCLDPNSINALLSKDWNQIKQLIFKRFNWFTERTELIATFVVKNKSIDTFAVLTVDDSNKGISPLYEALAVHPQLTHLKVAVNTISTESVYFMMNCLDKAYRLQTLDLSYVTEAAASQANFSKRMGTLNRKSENLAVKLIQHLAGQKIGTERNPDLRILRLKGCEIGKIGVKQLRKLLCESSVSIAELDVSFNQLHSEGVIEVCKAIEFGCNLSTLDISHNAMEERGVNKICEVLT